MTDNRDDIFRPKLGRMRDRGNARPKTFINRVLKQIAAEGASGVADTTQRGRVLGLPTGGDHVHHRRVVIKTRIVKFRDGQLGAARAHLRYIQRDGVTKDNDPGRLYDGAGDDVDGKSFLNRGKDDRHQFRFIVSPEDATEMQDLKPFIRDLMVEMEKDLSTRLDWVAVDHFNTAHPHTHIVMRGKTDRGTNLIIPRNYIAHGMRQRANELVSLELGPRSEREIRARNPSEVQAASGSGSLDGSRSRIGS